MPRRLLTAVLCLTLGAASAGAEDPAAASKTLVERWLAAQNAGDFSSYQSLYAARFTGVRRSGTRVVHLNRAGWMRDRGRMFAKKMAVSAQSLEVAATPVTVRLTFTQKWESGSYKDVGKKQLILVREGGAWKIAREDMLSSQLLAAPPASMARDRFAFVVAGGVVLDTGAGSQWAQGPPELVAKGVVVVVARPVDSAKLPAALARWQGRKLRVLAAGGKSCQAQVAGFRLIGRQVPHFGQREAWQHAAPTQIAAEAWAQGDALLVGTLTPGCTGAWARLAELPAPAVTEAKPADTAARAAALREFRRLPGYATIQKSFREDHAKGAWEEAADSPRLEVLAMPAGGKTLISVSARAGAGCGGFEGELTAIWEATGDKLKLRGTADTYLVPTAAVDLDGDGWPEILYRASWIGQFLSEGVLRLQSGQYRPAEELTVPYHDCPC